MRKIETGSPIIGRYDDVVSSEFCDSIVEHMRSIFPENKEIIEGHLPWHMDDRKPFRDIKDIDIRSSIDRFRFLLTQLTYQTYNEICYPHFTDIVLWREGMSMGFHKDDGYEGPEENIFRVRHFSSVLYLNDDYEGGETVIKQSGKPDFISVPKKGSIVIFKSNDECLHGVNKVTRGTRYTMPSWLTRNIEACEVIQ